MASDAYLAVISGFATLGAYLALLVLLLFRS